MSISVVSCEENVMFLSGHSIGGSCASWSAISSQGFLGFYTIRGESGGESGTVVIALVLVSIRPFFFLFFGGQPPRFFGWMTAKNCLTPCAPAYAFAESASNGLLGGAIVNEQII